jgi:hypothetical protein
MTAQDHQKPFAKAYDELDQGSEEQWQDRLPFLQQLIRELLITNQQLRMSLESAMARDRAGEDDRSLATTPA